MKMMHVPVRKKVCLLASNPVSFFWYIQYRTVPRWLLPRFPVRKRINGVLFEFDYDLHPIIKKMYFGCYEMETIEAMKNVLKPGDVFIDVGANIGYLSAIGASLVGKNGQVHSFEPVPQYFRRLEKMAMMNPDYKIVINQCALGEEEGTGNICIASQNIGWNTMVPNLMSRDTLKETLKVPIHRLDSYIKENEIDDISLIKIDVEGFEFPVLKGLQGYFEKTENRPVVICEVAPSAYSLLGCKLAELSEYLKKYDYSTFSLVNARVKVDITELVRTTNVKLRVVV